MKYSMKNFIENIKIYQELQSIKKMFIDKGLTPEIFELYVELVDGLVDQQINGKMWKWATPFSRLLKLKNINHNIYNPDKRPI